MPACWPIMLAGIITKFMSWAVGTFYDVERTGPPLVEGAVLVTANHPNALVDPLVILRTGARPMRSLAKAPLFDQLFVGTILRALGGLPVYRREDGADKMHLNDRTFDAAIASLHRREAVQIYPEGMSHSEPSMAPLRTGAARIAFLAEERSDWSLGLHIQPVGLTYTRKQLFRGRAIAAYGAPIAVAALREAYEDDPREAVRRLTQEVRERLEGLTLNLEEEGDRELVEVAERIYAREKGMVRWRERATMADRLPRLQRFSDGLQWLRNTDPERYEDVRQAVRSYLRLLTVFGATEADVPPRYRLGSIIRYSLRQTLFLSLVLPAALLGAVFWLPPFIATRKIAPRFRPAPDQVATYKLSLAILAFPPWYAILTGLSFFNFGLQAGLLVLVAAPVAGLAAIAWREREARVREDTRVFLRALTSPKGQDRLRASRARLVAEFDALADAMRAERRADSEAHGD